MTVRMSGGQTCSSELIVELERQLGFSLPSAFREYVATNDGAKPDCNTFKVGVDNAAGVNRFIPVSEIHGEMQYLEPLGSRSFPIAWADGGNYVLIDMDSGGSVYFWDHELRDNRFKLTDGFDEFLELLESFDLNSVQLKPGQTISAWIDPEFLNNL